MRRGFKNISPVVEKINRTEAGLEKKMKDSVKDWNFRTFMIASLIQPDIWWSWF